MTGRQSKVFLCSLAQIKLISDHSSQQWMQRKRKRLRRRSRAAWKKKKWKQIIPTPWTKLKWISSEERDLRRLLFDTKKPWKWLQKGGSIKEDITKQTKSVCTNVLLKGNLLDLCWKKAWKEKLVGIIDSICLFFNLY